MQRVHKPFLTRLVVATLIVLAALPGNWSVAAQSSGPATASPEVGFTDTRTAVRVAAQSPDATEEEDNGITRTPRRGGDDTETPEPTEDVEASGLEVFTGPVYGYSVSFDPEVWELGAEIHEGKVDGVQLRRESSTFTIWAWDTYGSDPIACLEGEIDYYSTEVDEITDWEPVVGANGEPLRYESDDIAWAVSNLIYTDDQGRSYPVVDYLSCEPIPGQDAVLIVLLSSDPEVYNNDLDHALDVLDTLQFADVPDDGTDGTDTGITAGEEISISLDGTAYTSPNYGFTATIPLEWQILEESVDGTEEVLVVSNGTSIVTLWATADHNGDLASCVDFAADASGLALELDSDASGGDFRGVYRNEAFGNFVYEDDGVRMMYFINCQTITGTDAHLILIHEVEYDLFTSERRFRAEIENSITMP